MPESGLAATGQCGKSGGPTGTATRPAARRGGGAWFTNVRGSGRVQVNHAREARPTPCTSPKMGPPPLDSNAADSEPTDRGSDSGPAALGQRIRSFRKRAHLSQQELSGKTGMSTRALRDIERGRVQRPQLRTVQRLVAALELSDAEAGELHDAARDAAPRTSGRLRFLVLGPLAVHRGDTPVPVTRPMLRHLLGLLVLKCPAPATHQEIVEALWPAGPPGSYQSLIHTYVSQVRRLLEPDPPQASGAAATVERVPSGYRLRVDAGQTDIGRFDELVSRARRAHGTGHESLAFESLTAALECWRGPLLADLDSALRQHPMAVSGGERRSEAALLHADLALRMRRPEQSLRVLWDLAHEDPLHEGIHARLMLALAGCGEQAAALNVFTTLRERLDEQLGIAPSEEIRHAHMRVLRQQIPRTERSGFDAARSAAPMTGRPAQLPADTPTYVGRETELLELDRLLSCEGAGAAPVVTVIGPPGVGKTALALRWAHAHRSRFADGQLFVNLQGHSALPALRPEDVLARFLRALGVPPDQVAPSREEAAATYRTLLADKRMLIVLDNAADVDQVRPLVPGEGNCRVVITSRGKLAGLVATEGAHVLGLDVLSRQEAWSLLGRVLGDDRVRAEPEAVAELARLCGWLPLALRIAAANLIANRNTTIAEYCAKLRGGNLLSGLQVDGDERATIRVAFDLSYLALPEPARRTFRLLGLLPGPDTTPHGAAALTGTGADEAGRVLRHLADAHLVQEPVPGRFATHDLLRAYARDLADGGELDAARDRLLDWYLVNAETAARMLYPEELSGQDADAQTDPGDQRVVVGDHRRALDWLESERESLVGAVLAAADAGCHRVAWRLAEVLHGFLSLRAYTADCLSVATAGLSAATADGNLRARSAAQLRRGDCYWVKGDNLQAQELFKGALALARAAGWLNGQAMALRRIGAAHQENGATRQAAQFLSQAWDLTKQSQGTVAPDDVTNLGLICWKLGRLTEAADHHAHAARLFRRMGSASGEAIAQTNLGITYRALGRPQDVIRVIGEALRVHEQNGNKTSVTVALSCLSAAHSDLGDHTEGMAVARLALESAQSMRNRRLEANAFFSMGAAYESAGSLGEAAECYRRALYLAESMDDRYPQVYALINLAATRLRQDRPDGVLATVEQAIGMARQAEFRMLEGNALNVLAGVRLCLKEGEQAMRTARQALALHHETGHRPGEARSHLVLGSTSAMLGEDTRAFGHWRTSLLLFQGMGMPGFGAVRPRPGRAG